MGENYAEIITETEEDISGFDFEVGMIDIDPDFEIFSTEVVKKQMLKQGYKWGHPLTESADTERPQFKGPNNKLGLTMGLGFKPTGVDKSLLIQEKNRRRATSKITLRPYTLNLDDYFVKSGDENPLKILEKYLENLKIKE